MGDDKYRQQHADAERERRRKKKEQAEMAAAAEELEREQQQQQPAEQAQAQQQAQPQPQPQPEEVAPSAVAQEQRLQALRQQCEEEQANTDRTATGITEPTVRCVVYIHSFPTTSRTQEGWFSAQRDMSSCSGRLNHGRLGWGP